MTNEAKQERGRDSVRGRRRGRGRGRDRDKGKGVAGWVLISRLSAPCLPLCYRLRSYRLRIFFLGNFSNAL